MAFDQSTRNRLQKFVSDAHTLLSEEFTRQLQNDYGLDPHTGTVSPLENLGHLDDTRLETARILRETLAHYLASSPSGGAREALERIIREQAFTVLNRLAALRMTESRGILIESVGNGYQSKGFQLYERLAGSGLGETGDTYRCYLFSIFDEFALDLKVLFDRFSPQGRLFPRETALLDLLKLLNDPELAHLWAEDETIGWIYQYFNSKEERKKMRDESAAPRNSRELAVRNQFFTPRYVVEFLTDNTLGRIWYEMTQGETGLKDFCRYLVRRPAEIFLKPGEAAPVQAVGDETLSQEELFKQPVYISHRPLKDPRTLRMLDPACGSMHFGLYSFDLYERIYEEAWELELRLGGAAFVREAGLRPLTETYPDKDTFLRDVPRLIIEHNIHGIDIDPRAVQIAGLSLWLRAQRSWHNQGVKPAERPRITHSNIVCAEPMPGEKELLREFAARLEEPALGYLVEKVFDKMQLAGEAGSLLQIEEEIRDIIAEAKRLWKAGPKRKQMGLFGDAPARAEQLDLPLEYTGITDERFWDKAEEKLYQALQEYAEVAGEHAYQRRLFVEDAARGFALINVSRKRFDVVLMNPPFGEFPDVVKSYLDKSFSELEGNILCGFICRILGILTPDGISGFIIDKTVTIKSSYSSIREKLLQNDQSVSLLIDLGWGVLDGAQVETVCMTVGKPNCSSVLFYKPDVATLQLGRINCNDELSVEKAIIRPVSYFLSVPNMAFAYDLPIDLLSLFIRFGRCEPNLGDARQGLGISDSWRWYRAAWEIPIAKCGRSQDYSWIANGGGFAPFYRDADLTIYWKNDGRAIKQAEGDIYGSWSRTVKNVSYYFRKGVSFPKRTDHLNAHVLPMNFIFTVEGLGFFPNQINQIEESAWNTTCLFNSRLEAFLINRFCGQHKHVGYIKKLPAPNINLPVSAVNICRRAVTLKQTWAMHLCNTYLFVLPAILNLEFDKMLKINIGRNDNFGEKNCIKFKIRMLDYLLEISNSEIQRLQEELDSHIYDIFGIDHETRALIYSETAHRPLNTVLQGVIDKSSFDQTGWLFELQDYCIGVLFGRFDICFVTGEKLAPELPAPFAPLPACPPGILQNAQNLPADPQDLPADYPLRISWPGILVDDEGHGEDIVSRLHEVFEIIWKDMAGNIEQEVCEILGVRSLRDNFCRPTGFFVEHLKRYSKSRRPAPIYWPLSTPSCSYTLWIYYHRLNDQTLYICVMDYVEPKLRDIANELFRLRQKMSGRNRAEEKEMERLQDFEIELQEFRDELLRVVRLPWKPNLNDGVQITAAPLWKLFQLPKWKKTLKETWEKLEKGDYDWAHLAYSIWPDRVREKCKKDKSLAIAHDLEDLYIEPPASTKKKRGKKAAVVEDQD